MEPVVRWPPSRRLARWLDVGVCAAVGGLGVAGSIAAGAGLEVDAAPLHPVVVALSAMTGAVLAWRRTRPLAVLGALVAIVTVAAGAVPPGLYGLQVGVAFVIACYALGAWSTRRWAVALVGALLVLVTVGGSAANGNGWLPALAVALTLVALPIVVGVAARSRRRYLDEVEHRLAESEARQDERARLAIQDERNRIARELHDVVAHHVSLIGVQAGAARSALDSSPDRTREALVAIEQSSREAVGEMRQLVEVLQPVDGPGRAPQPGLADLDELVARWRSAGYSIAFDAEAARAVGAVAPTLELSCYRVVEEALTNVARHSRAQSASVAVRSGPGTIEIAVHDPGPPVLVGPSPPTAVTVAPAVGDPSGAPGPRAGGRGLVGMAERAALFGGRVAAGPTPDGGFAVVASMPCVAPG